jgi:hypothetical protein
MPDEGFTEVAGPRATSEEMVYEMATSRPISI